MLYIYFFFGKGGQKVGQLKKENPLGVKPFKGI